jgi:hypothetical protein
MLLENHSIAVSPEKQAMKKVSIVAAQQSGNFSQLQLTMGLDSGDRSSCYRVLDGASRIQVERTRTALPRPALSTSLLVLWQSLHL